MRMLLIAYDLKSKTTNYEPLFSAIKATGNWWHYLKSTWLVCTDQAAYHVATDLQQYIDKSSNDYILVIEVKKAHQGWLPKKAWEWMNSKAFD